MTSHYLLWQHGSERVREMCGVKGDHMTQKGGWDLTRAMCISRYGRPGLMGPMCQRLVCVVAELLLGLDVAYLGCISNRSLAGQATDLAALVGH